MTTNTKLEQNFKLTYDSKIEQVDASVRFVMVDQPAYYEALRNLPGRVVAALLILAIENPEFISGYHYRILQKAHFQFARTTGFIGLDEAPFHDN